MSVTFIDTFNHKKLKFLPKKRTAITIEKLTITTN